MIYSDKTKLLSLDIGLIGHVGLIFELKMQVKFPNSKTTDSKRKEKLNRISIMIFCCCFDQVILYVTNDIDAFLWGRGTALVQMLENVLGVLFYFELLSNPIVKSEQKTAE